MRSFTEIEALAITAGRAILDVYAAAETRIETKADTSPLTEADRRSHVVIVDGLARLTSRIPVVSEEDEALGVPSVGGEFWLVDPLDGTKEFIKRTGEFTVNIALVRDGAPVFGVVHAPVLGISWIGSSDGAWRVAGAARSPLKVAAPVNPAALRLVASRDHAGPRVSALLERLPGASTLSMGSSLKFCLVAEGRADLYFRDGPTMPWDTAAAHAVLAAAGGAVWDTTGRPLRYHEPRELNPEFLAVGDTTHDWVSYLTPESKE